MMFYKLRNDLSFCQVGGHFVFLDIQKDRYFRLSDAMERRFSAYVESSDQQDIDIRVLVECDILIATPEPTDFGPNSTIVGPTRSVMEEPSLRAPLHIAPLLEVLAIVYATRMQQKSRSLKEILTSLIAYRQTKATPTKSVSANEHERRLSASAAAFRHTRLYVPVETCCLLDSIAMIKFLAKRGLYASIVFGIIDDPFSAHCWAQSGHLALNDTVGHANAHTPIRVV